MTEKDQGSRPDRGAVLIDIDIRPPVSAGVRLPAGRSRELLGRPERGQGDHRSRRRARAVPASRFGPSACSWVGRCATWPAKRASVSSSTSARASRVLRTCTRSPSRCRLTAGSYQSTTTARPGLCPRAAEEHARGRGRLRRQRSAQHRARPVGRGRHSGLRPADRGRVRRGAPPLRRRRRPVGDRAALCRRVAHRELPGPRARRRVRGAGQARRGRQGPRGGANFTLIPRSRAEVARFFEGLELAEPGLVSIDDWRPDGPAPEVETPNPCGVARKVLSTAMLSSQRTAGAVAGGHVGPQDPLIDWGDK